MREEKEYKVLWYASEECGGNCIGEMDGELQFVTIPIYLKTKEEILQGFRNSLMSGHPANYDFLLTFRNRYRTPNPVPPIPKELLRRLNEKATLLAL